MLKRVEGTGPADPAIMIVGEAPGADEEALGEPFVGSTGRILNRLLADIGTSRSEVYLTNVVKVRPPGNDLKALERMGITPRDFYDELRAEVFQVNPVVVVAFGTVALEALTGLKGIMNYRGSILPNKWTTLPKVIPTIHIASLMHGGKDGASDWKQLAWIRFDLARALEESYDRALNLPERTLTIPRSVMDVIRFMDMYQTAEYASVDVETSKTYPNCIGFACESNHAISIPLLDPDWDPDTTARVWKLAGEFLQDTRKKLIAQNAKFDEWICEQSKLKFHDLYFDLMRGTHTLFPEFPKSLQFQTTLYTREPYYKDEGKEFNPTKHDRSRLYLYNAKDAAVTIEIFHAQKRQLEEVGLWQWCIETQMPYHRLYYNIERTGILCDQDRRKELRNKYQSRVDAKQAELDDLIGAPLNVNSPKQVALLLYESLRLPQRADTGEDTIKALMNNHVKDPNIKRILQLILEIRKTRKSISTYLDADLCDGRIKTLYRIEGTENGRTSTSIVAPPVAVKQYGIALQTMTKHEDVTLDVGGADLRDMFIADPGYCFVEVDGSQAEDRVVAVLSDDLEALELLQKKTFNYNKNGLKDDRHSLTACDVCELTFEQLTDYERQIGKRTRHAANLGVRKRQLMLTLGKFGIYISEWRAGQFLERLHAKNPKIREVFHREIEEAINRDQTLYSPHGRRRQFYGRIDYELYKEAYAFLPQATVSDMTKSAMLLLSRMFTFDTVKFVQEAHDSFLALVRKEATSDFVSAAIAAMQRPIDFANCTLSRNVKLVIPADVKIGDRWSTLEKYKAA